MRDYKMYVGKAMAKILKEVLYAQEKFPPFTSGHEGYAIIKEELDELWDVIKSVKDSRICNETMIKEAIQVGAMAVRFLIDCDK